MVESNSSLESRPKNAKLFLLNFGISLHKMPNDVVVAISDEFFILEECWENKSIVRTIFSMRRVHFNIDVLLLNVFKNH